MQFSHSKSSVVYAWFDKLETLYTQTVVDSKLKYIPVYYNCDLQTLFLFLFLAVTFKFSRPVFPEHPFTNPSSGKFVMDKSFRLFSNHWKTSHYHLLLLHHHFDKRGLISRFPLNRSLIGMIYHFLSWHTFGSLPYSFFCCAEVILKK